MAKQKKKSLALQLKIINKSQIKWQKEWLARYKKNFAKNLHIYC